MNAEVLLEHFHRLGDAPDALPRLRRFILDLAVQGKLVPQVPNEESASRLLEQIRMDIARAARTGRNRPDEANVPVEEEELPFSIPKGWATTRFASIAICLDHMRSPINSTERDQRIEGKEPNELYPYYGATQQQGWIDEYIFDEELVLLGEDGVPFLDDLRPKAYIITGKTWVNNHAHVFRVIRASSRFVLFYLNTFNYQGRIAGATRGKLNKSKAIDIPLALPPLAEQHRIVAKVDELMALCDRLEAAQQQREQERMRLTAAAWQGVVAEPAVAPAHFALEQLPALTARPEQVKALRQTILDLAVRGRLVEQDERDEPVGVLLERLKATREVDTPFELQTNWSCIQAQALCRPKSTITYGVLKPVWVESGVPTVRVQDMKDGELILSGIGQCAPERASKFGKTTLEEGDLLIAKDGATLGKTAFVPPALVGGNITQHVLRFPISTEVDRRFVRLVIDSPIGQAYMRGETKGMALPGVNVGDFRRMLIPLPPLAEQRRIVAKVDELTALCDGLEAALQAGEELKAKALEGVLRTEAQMKTYTESKDEMRMARSQCANKRKTTLLLDNDQG